MALPVAVDLTFVAAGALDTHDFIIEMELQDLDWGYLTRSRQTICVYFALPPIIGFALAIALRKYIRNLLLRNQEYLRKEMQGLSMRYKGLGLKEFRNDLREAISAVPQFLPLLSVFLLLCVLDYLVFPRDTLVFAFLATSGFASYGTWKRIFTQ